MNDERIRRGATFQITLTDEDITANTVTLTLSNEDGIIAQETANYSLVDEIMTATISLDTADLEVGDYDYMYTIVYSDGHVEKLPEPKSCSESSENLPIFTICEANDIVEGA